MVSALFYSEADIKCIISQSLHYIPAVRNDAEFGDIKQSWEYPRGVMVKAMDCGIVVSEFVLQSRYYVHFRANTLGNGMNPLILPAILLGE